MSASMRARTEILQEAVHEQQKMQTSTNSNKNAVRHSEKLPRLQQNYLFRIQFLPLLCGRP
jgi:hypothetical protein